MYIACGVEGCLGLQKQDQGCFCLSAFVLAVVLRELVRKTLLCVSRALCYCWPGPRSPAHRSHRTPSVFVGLEWPRKLSAHPSLGTISEITLETLIETPS